MVLLIETSCSNMCAQIHRWKQTNMCCERWNTHKVTYKHGAAEQRDRQTDRTWHGHGIHNRQHWWYTMKNDKRTHASTGTFSWTTRSSDYVTLGSNLHVPANRVPPRTNKDDLANNMLVKAYLVGRKQSHVSHMRIVEPRFCQAYKAPGPEVCVCVCCLLPSQGHVSN